MSVKLDEILYETLEDRIQEVQKASGMSWIEARFMKNAVEELSRCRYTLKWTYSMAFFLKAGNAKQIFEDLQA
jgi:ariadne-1